VRALLDARILSATRVTGELVLLTFDRPAPAVEEERPGQYVLASTGGLPPVPFALASAAGAARWELLVRAGEGTSGRLASLVPGNPFSVSLPLGNGFSLEGTEGKELLLVAAGTGLSALRPLVLHACERRGRFGRVTLLHGARSPDELAWREETATWRSSGAEVVHVVSRPADTGWDGPTGHVQSHLEGRVTASTVAFLCGPQRMLQDCTTQLRARGLRDEDIRKNF
jgi:NAD(P)H-flavin reductase